VVVKLRIPPQTCQEVSLAFSPMLFEETSLYEKPIGTPPYVVENRP
jgi:hypothetical protein